MTSKYKRKFISTLPLCLSQSLCLHQPSALGITSKERKYPFMLARCDEVV